MHNSIQLYWFRESLPGHLEQDRGLRIAASDLLLAFLGLHAGQSRTAAEPPVTLQQAVAALHGAAPLDTLPLWARKRLAIVLGSMATPEECALAAKNAGILADVARRIAAELPDNAEIELHLPYISRRAWPHRFEILENTRFVRSAGRFEPVALQDLDAAGEYNAQLLTICSCQAGGDVELVFSNTRRAHPGLIRALLPVDVPMLECPAEAADVEVRMALPGSACRAWCTAPHESDSGYFEAHAPVSVALQNALRRWFAWLSLADVESFKHTEAAYIALGYLASAPFPGRRRTDFTYDTLGTDWMDQALRHARSRLRPLLLEIRATLFAAGGKNLAGDYDPRDLTYIVGRVRKARKSIRALVAAETDIVNYILRIGIELQGVEDPMRVMPRIPDFARGLGLRLRRMFRERYAPGLVSLLLIEATNALSVAQGREASVSFAATVARTFTPLATNPQVPEQPHPVPCPR